MTEPDFIKSSNSIVKINLNAIEHNLNLLSEMASYKCQLMPVIKSDAYGHGMVEVARLLQGKSIWGLGIYELEEAEHLRRQGITCPIFLLSGLLGADAEKVLELDVTVGAVSVDEIKRLNHKASILGRKITVHVKLDTGMSRFGMTPEEVIWLSKNIGLFKNIDFEGLFSHLACADTPNAFANEKQIGLFNEVIREIKDMGWHPQFLHIANSAALVFFKGSGFNMARPGIALYGGLEEPSTGGIYGGFRQAMSFCSRIVHLRQLPRGVHVSYGHTFRADAPIKIALVPVGYDNGYHRALSNRAEVIIRGERCQVVGNICMKTIMVDVTSIECKIGDQVVIMGESGRQAISAVELARRASTISYEILCNIGKLNRRIFL